MKTMKMKAFILIESIIFVSFIIMDFMNMNSIYIKYLGIVICFVFSLLNKNYIISLAQLFTLIADYFLLVIDNYYVLGLISFIVVQMIYMYFLYNNKAKLYIYIRLSLIIIAISLINKLPLLYVLVLCYFSMLIMNTITSYSNRNLILLSIGFTLFIGCDVSVGLHNILNSGLLYDIATMSMWIFYLPSQVLITIGGLKNVNN